MKIRKIIFSSLLIVASTIGFSTNTFAAVTCPSNTERSGSSVSSLAECNLPKEDKGDDLISKIDDILKVIIPLIALAAVGVVIFGGIQYTLSAGDPAKITKAKNTILYGIIGLVVALLAYAIVSFVLGDVLGYK